MAPFLVFLRTSFRKLPVIEIFGTFSFFAAVPFGFTADDERKTPSPASS
jgi:hypothetical protein